MGAALDSVLRQLRLYALDMIVALFVSVGAALAEFVYKPNERFLMLGDPDLSYPYQHVETVPTWLLIVVGVVIPIIAIVFVSLVMRRNNMPDTVSALVGLWLAVVTTILVTDLLKNYIGRFRPDFYDRCQWDPITQQCTGEAKRIEDGRKSFPSGHSSLSFAGLSYMAFYMAGRLDTFRLAGRAWKYVLFVAPLVGAALVAGSRINDYRHHWQDVLVGGLLGTALSYLAYRQYYPSLSAKGTDMPRREEELRTPHDIDSTLDNSV